MTRKSRATTCSVGGCPEPPAGPNTGYCRGHRNAYQRAWTARRRIELLTLRAAADDPVVTPRVSRETSSQAGTVAP